jgi:hypothetical protein
VETLPLNAGAAPAAGKSAADAPTSIGPLQRNLEKATCQVLKQIGSKTRGEDRPSKKELSEQGIPQAAAARDA